MSEVDPEPATRDQWARPATLLLALATVALVVMLIEPALALDPAGHLRRVARGALLTLALLLLAGALLQRRLTSLPLAEAAGDPLSPDPHERSRHDAQWFVHLRWLVAAVAVGLIACARVEARPQLFGWWAGLVVANIGFEVAVRRWRRHETQIVAQAIVDLLVLTGFLNASGGLENPLYTAFVLNVVVGRTLLPSRKALAVTLVAVAMFSFMSFGEYTRLLPHYTNSFFPHPEGPFHGGSGSEQHVAGGGHHAAYDLLFVLGRTVPLLAMLVLADLFMARLMHRLRSSEASLRRSTHAAVLERDRLERVVDAAGVGMMQVSAGQRVGWFSGRVGDWFSWRQDVLGQACPLLTATGGCTTCVARTAFESGRPAFAERHEARGRRERFHRHSASPIRDAAGAVVQVVEVIEDITDRRALEEEAIRAGKLSVLGRMAAGIAHEIGNPLSSITARLQLLGRRRDHDFVAQSVGVLREQIERIGRIVHGVSHFGLVRTRDRVVVEVNGLVEETVQVIELDPRAKGVRFHRELEEPSPSVRGVRDQIGQILLNLLLNAVEASPVGGVVTIRSQRRGDQVLLAVDDEGPGVDPAARDHLFEPFFTTKAEGTGLGLAISSGFATAHGGSLAVESQEGHTSFVLTLPALRPKRPR